MEYSLNYWGDDNRSSIAASIDAIGWHPISRDAACSADRTDMNRHYFDNVRAFMKDCEVLGFNGRYFANELYTGAIYPASGSLEGRTELQMAKYLLRCLVGHSGLNIGAAPCHPHFTSFPHPQSLSRVTWPVQTVIPCQPTPTYYTWRNAATAMDDDFYGTEFPVSFTDDQNIIYFTLQSGDKKQLMIASWLSIPVSDAINERKTDIILEG